VVIRRFAALPVPIFFAMFAGAAMGLPGEISVCFCVLKTVVSVYFRRWNRNGWVRWVRGKVLNSAKFGRILIKSDVVLVRSDGVLGWF